MKTIITVENKEVKTEGKIFVWFNDKFLSGRGYWLAALNLYFVMKVTAKEVLTSQNWIITRIYEGYNGKVRINAKRRYHVADKPDFFSKWVTLKYANSVRISEGLNKIEP